MIPAVKAWAHLTAKDFRAKINPVTRVPVFHSPYSTEFVIMIYMMITGDMPNSPLTVIQK